MVSIDKRTGVVLFVVGALLLSTVGGIGSAATTDGQMDLGDEFDAPAFIVELDQSGSATVAVTYTFNLSDESRQEAFQQIRDNQTERESFRTQFRDRFQRIAADTANTTGREMSASNAVLDFRNDGTTGVVEASVTWTGLAAVDGNEMTVTEPFASGFTTERPVHMRIPDGYNVQSVTLPADSTSGGTLTYAAGTDFTDFELVVTAPVDTATPTDGGETVTPTDGGSETATSTGDDGGDEMDGNGTIDTDGTETPSGNGPGFGVVATLGALLTVAALARRR